MDIETSTPNINKDDLLTAVLQKLKLQFGSIDVGFFVGTKYKNGKDITTVARQNDQGTKRIPERPFMIPGANKAANKTINITVGSIAGGMDESQALSRAGIMLKNAIQKEITNIKEPPNSPYTIEKKRLIKSINRYWAYEVKSGMDVKNSKTIIKNTSVYFLFSVWS